MKNIIIAITTTILIAVILSNHMIFNENIANINKRTFINSVTFVPNGEKSHQKSILDAKKNKIPISYFIKQSNKDAYGNPSQNYYFIVTPQGKMIGYSTDEKINGMIVKYLDPKTNFYWNSKNYPVKTKGLNK